MQLFGSSVHISSMSNDDTELIARILGGQTNDFQVLVDRHKHSLYRHCFYIMRDEDTAEDMAQEAFIIAFHKLTAYDPAKGSFKTWLFTIGTRCCLQQLRKRRTWPLDEALALPDDSPSPQTQAQNLELWQAVGRLKPHYRIAITLYYQYGYSYEEISQHLNTSPNTLRSWLHRAKKQLKEALS